MDIYEVLDKIETSLKESPAMPWPWTDTSMIKRGKFLKILADSKENLPEEIKQARWVAKENQRIRDDAYARAEKLESDAQDRAREVVRAAAEEAQRLVVESEIAQRARQEAARIMAEVEEKARAREAAAQANAQKIREEAEAYAQRTRKDAEAYVLRILGGMEGELTRVLSIIQRGKESLSSNGAAPAPAERSAERPAVEPAAPPREAGRGRPAR